MVRGRSERVRVQIGARVVELSWTAAQELKGRLLAARAERLVNQFQRVGTSRPVVLDRGDRQPLLDVVLAWIGHGGEGRVPAGIVALRDTLLSDSE